MGIVKRIPVHTLERKWTKVPHYGRNASGYGKKIPSGLMVRLPGSRRWRRVYSCCFSNGVTTYVDTPEGWIVLTIH
jgi:hypothetical protein